jgi:hypothetical protein
MTMTYDTYLHGGAHAEVWVHGLLEADCDDVVYLSYSNVDINRRIVLKDSNIVG